MALDKQLHMLTAADIEFIRSIAREVFGESPRGVAIEDPLSPQRARYRYAELLEDCGGGTSQVWAKQTDAAGVPFDPPVRFKVQSWQGIISGAKAGFKARYLWYRGFWDFDQSAECITPCDSSGSITSSALPDAVLGSAYNETVSGTGVTSGTWGSTGLPSGLSMSSGGVITGTPTGDAGTYYVAVSATAPKTGPAPVAPGSTCTITKMLLLKLTNPPPPPPPPAPPTPPL